MKEMMFVYVIGASILSSVSYLAVHTNGSKREVIKSGCMGSFVMLCVVGIPFLFNVYFGIFSKSNF